MLQRIGRYEILERIAAGGQGTVYRARDTTLDRVVAVKVINQPVTDDPQYLEALQREARLAARLDHPNITRVHDFQVEDGTAFIVMEYVPEALDRHIRQGQLLPYQRAVEIAIQVARGLQHAHDNGVVHREHQTPEYSSHRRRDSQSNRLWHSPGHAVLLHHPADGCDGDAPLHVGATRQSPQPDCHDQNAQQVG